MLVIVECLFDGIKDATLPRIVADTSDVLPVTPVASWIVVHKEAFIPLCSNSPVDIQMRREERGDVLPRAIRCVACDEEFAV
jgi:hypothetical protein